MKLTTLATLLCLTFLSVATLIAQAPSIPHLIESEVQGYAGAPLWVSAQAAADDKAVLKWELFDEHAPTRDILERQWEGVESKGVSKVLQNGMKVQLLDHGNCEPQVLMADHLNDQSPAQSFRDLIEHSKNIFEGTVVAVEPGFYRGAPASLLKVKIHHRLRASDQYADASQLYVYHSAAHFKIGPFEFCGYSPGVEPKPGNGILVFDFAGLATKNPMLLTPGDDKVFIGDSSGDLSSPKQLRKDTFISKATSLEDLTTLVRKNLG